MTVRNPSVDEYLENAPQARRQALETVRELILKTVPQAQETMHYRMPTYEYDGVICSLASQKHYMSLYMDTQLVDKFRDQLGHLDCGKSCIRFKRIEDLPLDVVRQILLETISLRDTSE